MTISIDSVQAAGDVMPDLEKISDIDRSASGFKTNFGDSAACDYCGATLVVPTGSCAVCLNCGSSTGCS